MYYYYRMFEEGKEKTGSVQKKVVGKKPDILENYLKLNIKFNLDIKNELKKMYEKKKMKNL